MPALWSDDGADSILQRAECPAGLPRSTVRRGGRYAACVRERPGAGDGGGAVPESLAEQGRLIWRNIEAQLAEVGMSLDNVVKATTFLSDRKYAIENRAIRNEIMGAREPAITVIICGLFDEKWLLEIEVVAAA